MARARIEISESAIGDLQEIRAWYEEQHAPEVGERLVAEVLDRVETLAKNPELGRMVPEFEQNWLRELIHPPFRIVYKREPDEVQIVRVWRSERLLAMPEQE
ncbi:MAG: type II toxin-antitoxin system RelE/ParE family toxin [Spiribacter salinus]|uniref:Type II toxin-antitoxin system RelE/ParE family toxin n=1 Tax=Spiribacter salinus TaxID=1335746 RepID=A0A540V7F4_9GAMM|nr:MAG: type II toxin-antitoxin system RelE/ParE family toxin [Spiribacter salinus]